MRLEAERSDFIEQHGGAFEAEIKSAMQAADDARDELQRLRDEVISRTGPCSST